MGGGMPKEKKPADAKNSETNKHSYSEGTEIIEYDSDLNQH